MEWLENEYPDAYPEVINYVGSDRDIIQEYWKKACLHYVLVPSSAGMERIFSTMGLVHTNLRNKLSTGFLFAFVEFQEMIHFLFEIFVILIAQKKKHFEH